MTATCTDCRLAVIVSATDGHCRRYPPRVISPTQSTYPVINPVGRRCGEFRRDWWRWLWRRRDETT